MNRLSPFYRLILFIFLILLVFMAESISENLLILLFFAVITGMTDVDKHTLFSPIYKLRHFLLLIFLLNSLFSEEGTLLSFSIFRISIEGVIASFLLVYRVSLITLMAYVYTASSTINEINDSLYILIFPLKLLFIPVDMLSSALSLALNMIDGFMRESERLEKVRRLRSIGRKAGLKERILDYKSIVIPLFIMAFRKADDLSLSLEARGYSMKMRLRWEYLRIGKKEFFSVLISILILIYILFGGIL